MKLKKILALLTILLLTLTACKSTEEPVDDEKPLKLSERAGVYTGSITVNNGNTTFYSIVEVRANGEILVNATSSENPVALVGEPSSFNADSEKTVFEITLSSDVYTITFVSSTELTLKLPVDGIDACNLKKQ